MDRNTVIGFVLLIALFIGYFYFGQQGQAALQKEKLEKQRVQDSIAAVKAKNDSILTAKKDTSSKISTLPATVNGFKQDSLKEELTTLENEVIKITFTNKGGQPKLVELKNFKTFDKKPLILQNGAFNKISYPINAGGLVLQTSDLLFSPSAPVKSDDGSQAISFTLQNAQGQKIEHRYSLRPNDYMVDFNIVLSGADLVSQNTINLTWQVQALKQEKDFSYEKQLSQMSYVKDGDYDFDAISSDNDKKFTKPVDWVSLKQQFFVTSIIAKNKFENADAEWHVPADSSMHIIAQLTSNFRLKLPQGNNAELQLYYGPSDYKILKSYGNQMHNIVPLGSGIFAFVKYINRYFIMPVFDFMGRHIASFGLVIALLTIIIRLLISPLTYQSYLSGAKMKLLRPEIDALVFA